MKILGNRVYLEKPELPETKTYISEELKKQMEADLVEKYDRLKVFALGKGVLPTGEVSEPEVKVGDEVLVDPNGLRRGVVIQIDGKSIVSVSYFDIMHVW